MSDRIRTVDDPAALRALAHPLRLRLLATLRVDGAATASILGRRLGESSGATSFHLRTLARHGFVEDDDSRGNGRERWWRASHTGTAWSLSDEDDARVEAGRGLTRQVARDHARSVEGFIDELDAWPRAWREAVEISDRWTTLTPERLKAMSAELHEVIERYAAEPSEGEDAERVFVSLHAIPQRGDLP